MSRLVFHQGAETVTVTFDPPARVAELMLRAGLTQPHPCGGRGGCGKCAVEADGHFAPPTPAEKKWGARLSCQMTALGDGEVTLPAAETHHIETAVAAPVAASCPMAGRLGLAVDVGTTTLAARLVELSSGRALGGAECLNPQTAVAADVMGRIGAALEGKLPLLQAQALQALGQLLEEACRRAARDAAEVDALVVTGNTTMLYLLTGRDPVSLARAPFEADTLFGTEERVLGRRAYLPRCMNAFVGADITCAVLSSGMCDRDATALLCDVGTNGEIALWHRGQLLVSSTAAGPAFEGAGVSCGCGSVPGAVDRVTLRDGQMTVHTLDDAPAVGICGSGLIDATAAFLAREDISPTGKIAPEGLRLCEGVTLLPGDVRAVQLAKAAIAAGVQVLLDTAGIRPEDVETLYVAGGFGSHLNLNSAARIGLIPPVLTGRAKVLGNAALSGALALMGDTGLAARSARIASCARHVTLSGSPTFNEAYVENLLFGEDDDF